VFLVQRRRNMNTTIIGTGNMARGIGTLLVTGGNTNGRNLVFASENMICIVFSLTLK
jgi:hypothetical protein